jgi:hypothetical protein
MEDFVGQCAACSLIVLDSKCFEDHLRLCWASKHAAEATARTEAAEAEPEETLTAPPASVGGLSTISAAVASVGCAGKSSRASELVIAGGARGAEGEDAGTAEPPLMRRRIAESPVVRHVRGFDVLDFAPHLKVSLRNMITAILFLKSKEATCRVVTLRMPDFATRQAGTVAFIEDVARPADFTRFLPKGYNHVELSVVQSAQDDFVWSAEHHTIYVKMRIRRGGSFVLVPDTSIFLVPLDVSLAHKNVGTLVPLRVFADRGRGDKRDMNKTIRVLRTRLSDEKGRDTKRLSGDDHDLVGSMKSQRIMSRARRWISITPRPGSTCRLCSSASASAPTAAASGKHTTIATQTLRKAVRRIWATRPGGASGASTARG